MSLFRRILVVMKALGGGKLQILKTANIFSDYSLCSRDSKSLICQLISLATLSIGTIRLTATGLTSVPNLCSRDKSSLIAGPTSVYSLSQVAP